MYMVRGIGFMAWTRRFTDALEIFKKMELAVAIDTITSSQFITDSETLISTGGLFEFGFFSPVNTTNRYVGIWTNGKFQADVVWVANRNKPLKDFTGIVTMSADGNLVVLNGQKEIIWSSNVSNPTNSCSAQLLETGNLVLRDNISGLTLWESFQNPSNTRLAGMDLSTNLRTGKKVQVTSWKSPSDPSMGSFSMGIIDTRVSAEVFIWNNSRAYWRSGPWNGQVFIGVPSMYSFYSDGFDVVHDPDGTITLSSNFYSTYNSTYLVLDSQGKLIERKRNIEANTWSTSECDIYGYCGPFGICNIQDFPVCSCLRGFKPKSGMEWESGNWSSGCVRSQPLQCERINSGLQEGKEDGFLKLEYVKVPDFAQWSSNQENECKQECSKNCSCAAYAFDSGIGCMSWSGNLIDMKQYIPNVDLWGNYENVVDLYIRLAYSELGRKKNTKVVIIVAGIVGTITVAICTYYSWRWMGKYRSRKGKSKEMLFDAIRDQTNQFELQEVPLFLLQKLAAATNNFHVDNKLGQGGFGPVYRGKLHDGQEIAVKRLSRDSGQGLKEFMNEVVVISKLQHRNLVRLLGCCVEGEEKMLIYEYMPKKSLDTVLFSSSKQESLDWRKRFNIIDGIGRGLMYLHRDSRLKIIHRDLKASNILLDEELNPKISDFGMARIFMKNEDQVNTQIIVGTYGYISPEYAMGGRISEKSDVFSFGVLLLEIISGRKNSSFYHDEHSLSLLGFAWKLWNESNIVALVDPSIGDSHNEVEIVRCIHVGLLCVQEFVIDRPTMSMVLSMLHSEILDLPSPRQPAFTGSCVIRDMESSLLNQKKCSVNTITVTTVDGRYYKRFKCQTLQNKCSKNCSCVWVWRIHHVPGHSFYGLDSKLHRCTRIFKNMKLAAAIDTITSSQFINDSETIISTGGFFELGFFSPVNTTDRYVGIWSNGKFHADVVWVANRNKPLKDFMGIVTMSADGNLVVLNGQKEIIWSSNVSNSTNSTSAQLLETGNLVLRDTISGLTLWASFQNPSNTLLAEMEVSTNSRTGKKVRLTSWKSPSDASMGSFSCGVIRTRVSAEVFIWNNSRPYWRSGPWNGQVFMGLPSMYSFYSDGFHVLDDPDGTTSFNFKFFSASDNPYYVLDSQGKLVERYANLDADTWSSLVSACDIYGYCGPFGICNSQNFPMCSCLRGFEPKNNIEWESGNWTSGCVRSQPLQCERINSGLEEGKDDGFLKLEYVKVPDFAQWSSNQENDCKQECLKNSSCAAYAFNSGIGCMSWSGNLIDIKQYILNVDVWRNNPNVVDLYIRLAYLELERKKTMEVVIIVGGIVGTITIAICSYYSWRWMGKYRARKGKSREMLFDTEDENMIRDQTNQFELQEVPLFLLQKLAAATNNFHVDNKLGQGGFGAVYKGKLLDGQEIAVKRLSRDSGQGLKEFTNEVVVISKLQHRNLVRLLGCCVEGEEKMLIYEYMPKKSLDTVLFSSSKQESLDWRKRFNIIDGIGRGLMYLHRDSRLKIIHRDLKASNILLDEDLNPKISDFGMARIFRKNEDQVNTQTVVGTYGYISPKYAMGGHISEKSDVFSFGVLLLEIISGRKNTSFYHDEQSLSLLGFAWKLWNESNILALVDPSVGDSHNEVEIVRCIHVGLLCVQEFVIDRPTMSTVLSMLHSEMLDLPAPRQPAFTGNCLMRDMESPHQNQKKCSVNSITVTTLDGR
ncbi:uncharacterized protein LOC120005473 [Tripterygium wilfordii]|uniref:uncharacterized protein LOC120005473 n=1 Tax=Tripterygium wilfordii TaxID=458696 RepID=UPI0018F85054|nr:uncharacterized protein LOC120005473 [Tripterygium wilfordii]